MKHESPLLKTIAEEFAGQRAHAPILDEFCEFAAEWLHKRGLVGLGHSASGMALRFSNGDEKTLLCEAGADLPSGTSVQLTGNVEKLVVNQLDTDRSSFQITGR